jgi:putative drug exporter of the RND superfamily
LVFELNLGSITIATILCYNLTIAVGESIGRYTKFLIELKLHRSSLNFIARLNSRYPWLVLLVWLVIFAASLPFASVVNSRLDASGGGVPNSEWQQVGNILQSEFNEVAQASFVIVSESVLEPKNPAFLKKYNALLEQVQLLEGVTGVTRFDAPGIPIALTGRVEQKFVAVTSLAASWSVKLSALRALTKTSSDTNTTFLVTGATAVNQDFAALSESDVKNGELTALPLIAIVLVFVFGALVAAGLPVLVGVFSISMTMAALYAVTFVMPVSSFAQSVVTLFGLGAGIDYALLVVSRFRESLAKTCDARAAAFETTLTAGRSVLLSGLTVAIAMAGLLVPNLALIRSLGVAGLLTMLITVLVSVTALPALLAILGERINSPRGLKFLTRFLDSGHFWGRWADRVMARPVRWGLFGLGCVLLLALPALDMKLGYTGAFGLASGVESRRGLELIRPLELAGSLDTFEVLLDLSNTGLNAESRANWRTLDTAIAAWSDVRLVVSPFTLGRLNVADSTTTGVGIANALFNRSVSPGQQFLRFQIIPKASLRTTEVGGWLERIRSEASKAGFERVLIGGAPKSAFEITQAITAALPIAVLLVFMATFLVLMVAFGSILIPLKSIFLNTLTVAASYGIITLVFQNGFLANIFNAPTDVGVIDVTLPLVMFAVIFGLSMDYEIFLLTRVQEAHDAGLDTRAAVRIGLVKTGSVITSAALIMVIVFAAFIPGSVVVNKMIGLGLSVAVALDATIVRLVLVPTFMLAAGKWNWWLPTWLARVLPKFKLEH